MHTGSGYPFACLSLLALGCGLFGLRGDESVVQIECTGELPAYPAIVDVLLEQSLDFVDPNDLSSECGGGTSAEKSYRFVPPQSGTYDVSVLSDFDAVLYVIEAPCGNASVLDCEDGPGALATETLTVDMQGGDQYLIVVDGFTGSSYGGFSLSVQPSSGGSSDSSDSSDSGEVADCASVEKAFEATWNGERWSGAAGGSTGQVGDLFSSDCSVASGGDDAWRFEVPEPGVYRVSISTVGFLGLVSVRDPGCTEIACSDGGAGNFPSPSSEVLLTSGLHTIVVDSFDGSTGSYELLMEQVIASEQSPTCRQSCVGPGDCAVGEACLDTTNGQVCLPQLCEECFVGGLTCSSYPYSCQPIGCF